MIRILLLALAATFVVVPARADLINEWEPNPLGTDPATQNVELLGTPGANFNLWLLSIEGEGPQTDPSDLGQIDEAFQISGTYDAGGLAVVSVSDFENPTNTLVLTDDFTGLADDPGTDVDTDNDGIVDDTSFFGTIMDAIGVTDGTGSTVNFLYGAQLGGADFAYTGDEPKLIFRDGTTANWYAVNDQGNVPEEVYDLFGTLVPNAGFDMDPELTTFGATNPSFIPEPGTGLLGVLIIGLGAIRRRKN